MNKNKTHLAQTTRRLGLILSVTNPTPPLWCGGVVVVLFVFIVVKSMNIYVYISKINKFWKKNVPQWAQTTRRLGPQHVVVWVNDVVWTWHVVAGRDICSDGVRSDSDRKLKVTETCDWSVRSPAGYINAHILCSLFPSPLLNTL